jgi:hypothetical protein
MVSCLVGKNGRVFGIRNGLGQKCRVRSCIQDHLPAQPPPSRVFLGVPPALCPLSFFVLGIHFFESKGEGGIYF